MTAHCLNCGNPLHGHYCSHCGQRGNIERLNWKSFGEEVLHFFTHVEKGFLKTSLLLFHKPGKLCMEYLSGKRRSYHKPVSFLLIWITIFLLAYNLAIHLRHFALPEQKGLFDATTASVISRYRSIIELLILPFTAFVSWLVVARPGLNYIETVCIGFYLSAMLFMLLTLQYVVATVFGLNYRSASFDLVITGIYSLTVLLAGYDIYRRYRVAWLIPRILLSFGINVFIYFFGVKAIAHLLTALL